MEILFHNMGHNLKLYWLIVCGIQLIHYLPHPTKPHIKQTQRFSTVPQTEQVGFSSCCWQSRQTWCTKQVEYQNRKKKTHKRRRHLDSVYILVSCRERWNHKVVDKPMLIIYWHDRRWYMGKIVIMVLFLNFWLY